MQLDENGNFTMYLPEATERAIKTKLPSRKEIEGEIPDGGRLDPEKLKKLYTELKKAYYDCYEYAVITYEDGEVSFGETTEKCTVIKVKFDAEGITKILEKFADVFDNDDTLDEMFPYLAYDGKGASKQLADSLRSGVKNYEESGVSNYQGIYLMSESYVNAQNTALGVKYTFAQNDTEYVSFTSTDNGKNAKTTVEYNGKVYAQLTDVKSDGNSGNAELSIFPEGTADKDITFCIDYSGMGTFKALDKEVLGGTYTIYMKDTPAMRDMFLRSEDKLAAFTTGLKLTFSAEQSGRGAASSISVSHDKYGSVTINTDMQPGGDIPAVPTGCKFIDPIKEPAESSEMGYDLYSYLYGRIESDPALMKIDSDLTALGQTGLLDRLSDEMKTLEVQRTMKDKYSAYSPTTMYDAQRAAYYIYNSASGNVSMEGNDSVIKIRLWYDKDSKLTVLDPAGLPEKDIIGWFATGFTDLSCTYAEVWFWKPVNTYYPAGVTAVKCDSPDITAKLPDVYDFVAGCFPWDGDNMIDGYTVATYPELAKGESNNIREVLEVAGRYSDQAEKIFAAYGDYAKSTDNKLSFGASYAFDVYFRLTADGKVTGLKAVRCYDGGEDDTSKLFTKEDITKSGSGFIKAVEELRLTDTSDREFKLSFSDACGMTGVTVWDAGQSAPPINAGYFLYYTHPYDTEWDGNIPGIYGGHPVGTFPGTGGSADMLGNSLEDVHGDIMTEDRMMLLEEYNIQAKTIYGAYMGYEAESGNTPVLRQPFRIVFEVDENGSFSYRPDGSYTWNDHKPESIAGWFSGEDLSRDDSGLLKKLNEQQLNGETTRFVTFYYSGNGKLGGVAVSDSYNASAGLMLNYFDEDADNEDRKSCWKDGIAGMMRDAVCGTYPTFDLGTISTYGGHSDSIDDTPDDSREGTGGLTVAMWGYSEVKDMLTFAEDIAEYSIVPGIYEKSDYFDYLTQAIYGQGYGGYDVPDIFVLEPADLPYFIDFAMTADELGITESDTGNMFGSTKKYALNYDGKLAAFTPQITPGAFVYRKDIARKVLGTDDPNAVAGMISDWDKFEAVAKQMKESGYYMIPNTDRMLRPFVQNAENFTIDTDNRTLCPEADEWIERAVRMTKNGYTPQYASWWDDWTKEHTAYGSSFGDFMPLWGTGTWLYDSGEWAICAPPANYSWGSVYLCVSKDCKDPKRAAQVIKRLTCDSDTLEAMGMQFELMIPNNTVTAEKLAGNEYYVSQISENTALSDGAAAIKCYLDAARHFDPATPAYDEDKLFAAFTENMNNYFTGSKSYEEALDGLIEAMLQ